MAWNLFGRRRAPVSGGRTIPGNGDPVAVVHYGPDRISRARAASMAIATGYASPMSIGSHTDPAGNTRSGRFLSHATGLVSVWGGIVPYPLQRFTGAAVSPITTARGAKVTNAMGLPGTGSGGQVPGWSGLLGQQSGNGWDVG